MTPPDRKEVKLQRRVGKSKGIARQKRGLKAPEKKKQHSSGDRPKARNAVMESESVKQLYIGSEASLENPQQPKLRRIGQAEKSVDNECEVNDWHQNELDAIQRASEHTHKAEFVAVDQHAVQVRLEMLEACWTEIGDAFRTWLSTTNEPQSTYVQM